MSSGATQVFLLHSTSRNRLKEELPVGNSIHCSVYRLLIILFFGQFASFHCVWKYQSNISYYLAYTWISNLALNCLLIFFAVFPHKVHCIPNYVWHNNPTTIVGESPHSLHEGNDDAVCCCIFHHIITDHVSSTCHKGICKK